MPWPDSLSGPGSNVAQPAIDRAPASSFTAGGLTAVKLGSLFTGLTVIVNVWVGEVSSPPLSVPPLSRTATLNVEVAESIGRRRVGQRPIVCHSGTSGEQRRVAHVANDVLKHCLARFVVRPWVECRPAGNRSVPQRPRSPPGIDGREARLIVHRVDRDRKRLGR